MSISIEVFRELSTSFEKESGCCNLAESCSSVALNYRGASHKLMVGPRKINWGPTFTLLTFHLAYLLGSFVQHETHESIVNGPLNDLLYGQIKNCVTLLCVNAGVLVTKVS